MSKLLDVLFLAGGGGAPAALAHKAMRVVARIAGGAAPAGVERAPRAAPIPTDPWLRDDIGLAPLVADRPPSRPRTGGRSSPWFPTDNRLRDDIGLPPLEDGADG